MAESIRKHSTKSTIDLCPLRDARSRAGAEICYFFANRITGGLALSVLKGASNAYGGYNSCHDRWDWCGRDGCDADDDEVYWKL
ncbi:hypothetical protein ABW20_dc0101285 [Dactylellina cionopaga]|nr:hypothetical protein ABW20_dc0101285 [Dactylellina cionopaga]